jgi:regulator of replication initiation timing
MLDYETGNLEPSIVNTTRALVDKVDTLEEQMYNVSREMEILRRNKKEMLEIKSTGTEMKNVFEGLIY